MEMVPEDLRYSKEHEWVRAEGDEAIMGITDHAQSALGDITFVELPEVGVEVKAPESIATVESVKAASDVYAPVSGKIVKVNGLLADSPEIINSSPYEEGWLCRIKMSNSSELDGLMDAAAYTEYLKESAH
ncbi:MAG: glycine cleavage system protein GcvH [Candidatus Omnitrophica bacterium]|nr:glycine cleavage system protein GcvH [Candidatus Omnitrophota bacterium]